MSVQEKFLASQRSPSSWGLSFPHDHMVRTNASSTQVWRKGSVHTHFSRGPACKESHDMAGWTLSVVHVTTCRRTIWLVPYAIHLPRAYKLISPPSTVKSSSRMGKPMYRLACVVIMTRTITSLADSAPLMSVVPPWHRSVLCTGLFPQTRRLVRHLPPQQTRSRPFAAFGPRGKSFPNVCLSRSPWLLYQPPRHPAVILVFISEPLVSSGAVNYLFAVLGVFISPYPCPSLRSLLGSLSVVPPPPPPPPESAYTPGPHAEPTRSGQIQSLLW
jgi:hypothetical protein